MIEVLLRYDLSKKTMVLIVIAQLYFAKLAE